MINILEAQRAGLFGHGKILSNIIAGVIVGVVALPLAMAFAIASGARPEQGLYTAIIAGFLVSALGGSRSQIAGPTGAFIAILAGSLAGIMHSATLHFLRRMASSVGVVQLTAEEVSEEFAHQGWSRETQLPDVLVYAIEGPFFFGAAENFERALAQSHTDPAVLVLRLRHVPFMDMTGLLTLEEVIATLKKRGVRVILCEANERVKGKLAKAGLLELLGDGNYAGTLSQALSQCRAADIPESTAPFRQAGERRKKRRYHAAAKRLIEISERYFLGEKE